MPKYTVQPGDTLPSIARALLGDPGRWRELQLYNQHLLVNPADVAAGMQLRLPPGAAIPAALSSKKRGEPSGSAPAGLNRPREQLRGVARAGRRPNKWSRR